MTASNGEFNHKDGVSLRDHFDSRIESLEEKFDLQFRLTGQAVSLAERKIDERLSAMNEFREALKDQASTFCTRSENSALHRYLEEKVESLALSRAIMEGKASQKSVNVAYVIAALGLCVSIMTLVMR